MHEGICVCIPVSPPLPEYISRLAVCLKSLENQTCGRKMIDVVLGVATTPRWKLGPLADLAFLFGAVVVPWRLKNQKWYPSFVRNLAGRWSRRRLVTFVDVDAVMHPEWAEAVLETMKDEDYKVAVTVKTKMTRYPWNGPEYKAMLQSKDAFESLVRAARGNIAPGTGCGTVTTTELYERIGGLDEDFKGYGATDIDFTQRLEMAGVEIIDLTEETGIYLAHQHHDRALQDAPKKQVPCKMRSVKIMKKKLEAGALRRNHKGWGGLPWP